jgi:hypothetical protein
VNPQNQLVRVDPLGRVQTLATAAQGLDGPATLVFGTTQSMGGTQRDLYITNFSIVPFLSGGTSRPALVRVAVAPTGPAGLPRTGSAEAQQPESLPASARALGTWTPVLLLLGAGASTVSGITVRRRLTGAPAQQIQ